MDRRFPSHDLVAFAAALLTAGGLDRERAGVVAEVLIEGDLLGRSTHGLQLLPRYLDELETGGMARAGAPSVLADHGCSLAWDGRRLPGPWLVRQAMAEALTRTESHPVVTVTIGSSHHIAALQAYLQHATQRGCLCLLAAADPVSTGVAPHGGIDPCLSSNPIAAGIPTSGDPILIDISTSSTSFGVVRRAAREEKPLPGRWAVDRAGIPTDDPSVLLREPRGVLLPLGGPDLGFKGFALGLLVEALANALAGAGRTAEHTGWMGSVYVQVVDPAAFAGRAAFLREMDQLVRSCHRSTPRDADSPVRLPGEAALAHRRRCLGEGVAVPEDLLADLSRRAASLKVAVPADAP